MITGENKDKSHSLLLLLMKTFKWELLAGIFPRLAQTGFTMAQPYLNRTSISLFSDDSIPNAHSRGIGLIAAFAIVYIGIAVKFSFPYPKAIKFMLIMCASLKRFQQLKPSTRRIGLSL
jgi:hypothetical protein